MSSAPIFSPRNLHDRRERAGLSRTQLAVAVNRSETAVCHWENGVAVPRADQLGHLAQVLGCSVDDFFAPVNEDDPAVQARPSKNAPRTVRHAAKA